MFAKATDAAIESAKYEVHARVAYGGALWHIVTNHAAAAIESSFSRSLVSKDHERGA